MRFKRILVATDGGEPSDWAIDAGASLAAQVHADMAFVHVIPRVMADPADLGYLEAERIADLNERAEHYLSGALRRSGMLRADLIVREGVADTEIIDAAKKWKADLIVVGSHNRGRFSRLILGSTAES